MRTADATETSTSLNLVRSAYHLAVTEHLQLAALPRLNHPMPLSGHADAEKVLEVVRGEEVGAMMSLPPALSGALLASWLAGQVRRPHEDQLPMATSPVPKLAGLA